MVTVKHRRTGTGDATRRWAERLVVGLCFAGLVLLSAWIGASLALAYVTQGLW